MLMAYADGVLTSQEHQTVKDYLAQNPSARLRLEAFKATGRGLRDLFEPTQPVPARLIEAIMTAEINDRPSQANVLHLDRNRPSAAQSRTGAVVRRPAGQWMALAATLVIGVASGAVLQAMLQRSTQPTDLFAASEGRLIARGPLKDALENAPSATRLAAAGTGQLTVRPVLTFVTRGNEVCRMYDIESKSEQRTGGVACRTSGGDWRSVVQTDVAAAPSKGGVVPAGEETSPIIDAAIDRMIEGDVLGPDQERALLSRHWNSEAK